MTELPLKAAVYLRISLDRNMDGLAIERQREDCERIARAKGWVTAEPYVDQSKSATDKTKVRPAYDRMVADYAKGKFSALICWDLDRLTRQPRQLEDWIDAAEEHGLQVATANGEADLSTDAGRMFARIKATVARGEVDRKSARQSRAHRQRAEQGRAPKGVRPLGYGTQGDVVAHEADAVRKVYAVFNSGASLRAIAAGLSGKTGDTIPSLPILPRHTRTLVQERNEKLAKENKNRSKSDQLKLRPVPEDSAWSPSTVLGILRNPRYAGFSTYRPTKDQTHSNKRRSQQETILRNEANEPIRGQWKPIVDEYLWQCVQDILDDPKRITNRKGTERVHIGSGLYRCGVCDARVRGHSTRYRCAGHVMRSREQIDTFVLTAMGEVLGREDLADLLSSKDQPRLREIRDEVRKHRGLISRAERDYAKENIEGPDLKRIREQARAHIDALDIERMRLTAGTRASSVLGARNPLSAFDDADLAAKREVIDTLCEVRLHPHPRGRKTFNSETVQITWRDEKVQVTWQQKELPVQRVRPPGTP